MKEFLSRHSYIIIWILALVIVGSVAILIVQLNAITTGPLIRESSTFPIVPQIPVIPAKPPAPSVTLTIVTSAKGNSLFVQWGNLPGNTTQLDIFRGKTATTTVWSLWKTIALTTGELGNGSASFDIGSALEGGYSFYVQASSGDGNSSSTDNGTPLWTSSSTVPVVTTSTPPGPGSNPGSPGDNNPPSNPSSSPPQTPSSPPQNPPPSSPSSSNPGSGASSTPPPPPSGIPYYNPQVQISEYGNEPGNFWVQHVNQSIEIGWQNLPAGIASIVVGRSQSSDGPWNTILNQQNPGTSGSYSLQIVDDTVHDPYYYEMTAFNGTTTVATYGPAYLAGQ